MALGPLMLDLEGQSVTPREHALLQHPLVGGVILFARNVSSREQVAALTAEIRAIRPELLLAVDQEGGRVQRMREGYTRFPPMAALGAALENRAADGEQLLVDAGWLLGAEVIASGLDFSFAPVLDVDDCHCDVIGNRSFSADPAMASRAAGLFIQGLHEAGMAVTGKHFPGHGGVVADSHLETPTDFRGREELDSRDLVPFCERMGDLDAIMPAHIIFPAVDSHCVGFSRVWLEDILRAEMGFSGVIFSDDLSMKGADVAGGYPQKAAAALAAGCDMILVCNNREGALEVIDYLEATDVASSPRLAAMAARRQWAWSELEESGRRQQTRVRLNELMEGE